MVGSELLETGRLSEAIERVAAEVKAKPTDAATRIFYFELLALNGDLDRAEKQLAVLAESTGELDTGVGIYVGAIQAERERRQFFHAGPRPRVLADPAYANAYLEAIEHYAQGSSEEALTRLQEAAAERPIRGLLNGSEVHELNDSTDLLSPFLELIVDNHYAWAPWDAIQSLTIAEPKYLRDTLWTPASLKMHSGDQGEVLLFSLYVDSHLQADDLKLGHRTEWDQTPAGFTIAYGQKVVASGDRDWPILEIRSLEVEACQIAA